MRIFPNYVNETLYIQNISNTYISKVQILDNFGKILYESSPNLAEISVLMANFASETYVLSLQIEKQVLSKQVVVIR
ncbi:MAG: T9SS type A sorting domain-containing protein [Microscillaceae bacterium]|nr:T9SS type A sorting domain-containing protein [Microscillaceae bacterium]MDW8461564.1 T9SS type A sorting domain-containing protein [Cytophagales bacterium]